MALHLHSPGFVPEEGEVEDGPDKHVVTSDGGLVVLAADESDAGRYECRLEPRAAGERPHHQLLAEEGGALLCALDVAVDARGCSAPEAARDYRAAYADWCRELQAYQRALAAWRAASQQCSAQKKSEIGPEEESTIGNEISVTDLS